MNKPGIAIKSQFGYTFSKKYSGGIADETKLIYFGVLRQTQQDKKARKVILLNTSKDMIN